jgi:hypothetical protein
MAKRAGSEALSWGRISSTLGCRHAGATSHCEGTLVVAQQDRPEPPPEADVETVQVGDRWVNRIVGTRAVLAVSLTRAAALEAGSSLAGSWRVHHQVVYHRPA